MLLNLLIFVWCFRKWFCCPFLNLESWNGSSLEPLASDANKPKRWIVESQTTEFKKSTRPTKDAYGQPFTLTTASASEKLYCASCFFSEFAGAPFLMLSKSLRCRTCWPLYRSPEWRSQSTRDIQKVQKLTGFHKSGNEYVTSKNESFMILIWILEKDKGPRLHDYNITTQDTPDTFRSRLDSQIPTLEKLARSKDYLALCIRGCWSIGLSHDIQRWNHYSFTSP